MWTLVALATLLSLYIAAVVLVPQKVHNDLRSGGLVEIKPASLCEASLGGGCNVLLKSSSGHEARLTLHQDLFNSPIIVLPTTNADVFICVYDYDVDFQLLRFDVGQPFRRLPGKRFVNANVLASTCRVDRVTPEEGDYWNETHEALQTMARSEYKRQAVGLNLLFCVAQTSQSVVMDAMTNCGGQGVYGSGF